MQRRCALRNSHRQLKGITCDHLNLLSCDVLTLTSTCSAMLAKPFSAINPTFFLDLCPPHSAIISPEPPNATGRSLNLGRPSFASMRCSA